MKSSLRVAVLGVGGMGSAVCRALAKRGHRVYGLEQFDIAHALGSSHGESRLIRRAYFEHPDYVPLLNRAYALWDEVEQESGKHIFHRTGLLLVGPRGASKVLDGAKQSAELHGIPIETFDSETARARYPLLKFGGDDEALLESDAGYLEVERAVATQAALAVRDGAEIRTGAKVTGWRADAHGVDVDVSGSRLRVDRLVITSGAWARDLLGELGVPLSVHRNLLFWYSAPDWYAKGSCWAYERGPNFFYGFPKHSAYGVKIANHVPGRPLERPEDLSTKGWEADEGVVRQFLRETLPELAWPPSKVAACIYELSPDQHFVLDKHPAHPNVVVGAGFSGHGFKFSPVVGEALADLADSGSTKLPIGFLGLGRFKRQ